MAGKLIALESTNQQLLDKTAKYLALKLQSEGKQVEVMSFPQKKQNSSHFVESHQKGEYGTVNPYAASMFYVLDRYDATPQIKQYLDADVIVICKGFRGTSLATLGVAITDAPARTGFYIWADSLESGTFGIPRPDMSIVLSEELPTLYELCELFPKDYIFAINPTKIRNMLNKIIPPAPAIAKKSLIHTMSWVDALKQAGNMGAYSFEQGTTYTTIGKSTKANKLYASGLKELEILQEKALQQVEDGPKRLALRALTTPIGKKGKVATEPPVTKAYKNSVFTAQLAQTFEPKYGATELGISVLSASPRSEIDALAQLVLPKTELSVGEVSAALMELPISRKLELFTAYITGFDNAPTEYPLTGIQANVSAMVAYADLERLVTIAPQVRFTLQAPSPRWGFTIPDQFAHAVDAIEDCFASSLKLYSQLEAMGETTAAQQVVLGGHQTPCALTLDGAAIRIIATKTKKWQFASDVTAALATNFPLLTDTKK